MTGDRWGIEIEGGGVERIVVASALADRLKAPLTPGRKQGTNPTWRTDGWAITYDPSLKGWPRAERVEVSSPILERGAWPLRPILDVLRDTGVALDTRCGVHVHVSTSGMDEAMLCRLVRVVADVEPELLAVLPQARRRFNRPIRPEILSATPEGLRAAWFGGAPGKVRHYDRSRHHGLNLQSWWYRGTVEFRYLTATHDEQVLRAWVDRVWGLIDAARSL